MKYYVSPRAVRIDLHSESMMLGANELNASNQETTDESWSQRQDESNTWESDP